MVWRGVTMRLGSCLELPHKKKLIAGGGMPVKQKDKELSVV